MVKESVTRFARFDPMQQKCVPKVLGSKISKESIKRNKTELSTINFFFHFQKKRYFSLTSMLELNLRNFMISILCKIV